MAFTRMVSEQEFIELLQKRNSGTCSEEELQLIDEYIKTHNVIRDTDTLPDGVVSSKFDKISLAIDSLEAHQFKHRGMLRAAIRIAASVLLILSVTFLFYQRKDTIYNYFDPLTYISVAAKNGQNTTVNLPDGSVIVLNQNSKLTYSNRFNDHLREVSLIGEAYFKVAKNKNKPFIVHAGKLNTRVLGTSFNIEAYPFSKTVAVELITGKIWLTAATASNVNYILTPNQAVTYNISTGQAKRKNVINAENYTSWKDGKIKFSNTTMEEAVRRLNVTFRSHIELVDSALANQRIYGEFGINEEPVNVVSNLCTLIRAKYQTKPTGEIIIYPSEHSEQSMNKKQKL